MRRPAKPVESHEDLYWRFLFAAAVFLCLGTLFLRDPVELVWQAVAAVAAVLIVANALVEARPRSPS